MRKLKVGTRTRLFEKQVGRPFRRVHPTPRPRSKTLITVRVPCKHGAKTTGPENNFRASAGEAGGFGEGLGVCCSNDGPLRSTVGTARSGARFSGVVRFRHLRTFSPLEGVGARPSGRRSGENITATIRPRTHHGAGRAVASVAGLKGSRSFYCPSRPIAVTAGRFEKPRPGNKRHQSPLRAVVLSHATSLKKAPNEEKNGGNGKKLENVKTGHFGLPLADFPFPVFPFSGF